MICAALKRSSNVGPSLAGRRTCLEQSRQFGAHKVCGA